MLQATGLSVFDFVAFLWFLSIWAGFTLLVDFSAIGNTGLSKLMERQRMAWMDECARRDVRIFDSQIMIGLAQGAAFFASTSLIALGGALTLFQNTETAVELFSDLPMSTDTSPIALEFKTLGLMIVFAFCFFKFGWSYRLFNYASILMGAIPPADAVDTPQGKAAVARAARMMTIAGQHFNAGQRGMFLSVGYLCWYFGPATFAAGSTCVLAVLFRRQFRSRARAATLIE